MSTDGRYVAFQSSNAFFVGDLNGTTDIYVFDANAGSFPAGQALIVSHTPQPSPQSPIFAANGPSQNARIARDGTTIAYESNATDLGPADTNGASDVYAWAIASDSTLLVSRTAAGAAGNGGSSVPSVSSDGTKIAFASDASNLVSGDTNSRQDSFVRDMTTAATARASIGAGKVQGKQPSSVVAVSDSGRFAAFESAATEFVDDDLNGVVDVYLRDAQTDTTRRVHPEPNASSSQSSLDTGGRFMSFTSFASNLTTSPIADTNGLTDIYVRNSTSGATTLTSVGWNGSAVVPTNGQSQNSVISGNSRWVAFESFATNLRRGDPLGSTDTNGFVDVYVADRTTGATVRVSQAGDGTQALGSNRNPSISDDGRFVAFESDATGLDPVGIDTNGTTDVFVHDRDSDGNGIFDQVGGTTTRLVSSVFLAPSLRASANGASSDPAISGNGAFLTYTSAATNLPFAPSAGGITDTNGVNDIFRVTLANLDDVVLMSATVAGNTIQLANGASLQPTISDNGLEVAYTSLATNLAGFTFDTNGQPDVFRSARATGPPGTKLVVTSVVTWVLSSPGTVTANGSSTSPAMSGDGQYIAYESTATNLVANDTNGTSDVFVEDRTRGIVNGYGARELASTDTNLVHGSASSSQVAIAGDAHTVSFTTLSSFDTDDVGGFDVYTRAALVPDFSFPAQVSPSAVARRDGDARPAQRRVRAGRADPVRVRHRRRDRELGVMDRRVASHDLRHCAGERDAGPAEHSRREPECDARRPVRGRRTVRELLQRHVNDGFPIVERRSVSMQGQCQGNAAPPHG